MLGTRAVDPPTSGQERIAGAEVEFSIARTKSEAKTFALTQKKRRDNAMPTPVITSGRPVQFAFSRSGGAVVWARVDVWSGVGTPAQKREAVLFFEDSLKDREILSRNLAAGTYSCVFKVFVREDLNGTFKYSHTVGDTPVFQDEGDVNTGPQQGEGMAAKDQFVLVVD